MLSALRDPNLAFPDTGVIVDDPHDSWANIKAFDRDIASFGNTSIRVLDNGPLFSSLRVRSTYGDSTLTTDWILYAGSTMLEARVTLDWSEKQRMLKFCFPVDVTNPQATWEIPYGHVSRAPTGGEEPGQRWIDLSGQRGDGTYGFAVINDAKYGYSVTANDLRVSIVRSPLYGHRSRQKIDPNKEYNWQNQGRQTFRMLLIPHTGTWRNAGIVRIAEEFCTPLPIILQGIHPGSRPQADSLLGADNPNNRAQQGRLARTVRPDQRNDLSLGDPQGHVENDVLNAVTGGHVLHFQKAHISDPVLADSPR